jgi:hypothetical protein
MCPPLVYHNNGQWHHLMGRAGGERRIDDLFGYGKRQT